MNVVRYRLVVLCQLLAQSALRHRGDQQRAGHYHQQPLNTAGLFDKQRRDKKQRVFEQAKAPFDTGLAFMGLDDFGIAQFAGVNVRSEDKARLALLPLLKRLLIRPGVGLDVPLDRLQRRVRCRTAFACIAFVCDQAVGSDLVLGPAPGQLCERFLGHLGCLETLGLQVKELLCDGCLIALPRGVDGGLGALIGRLCMHHQPALGEAVVAPLKTLKAGLIIKRVPGVRCEGLPNHLGERQWCWEYV